MNLPIRKRTRLDKYDYSSNGLYFLTLCTKDRQKLLGEIVRDGAHDVPKVELSDYGRIVEKYILSSNKIENVTVDKYVIMPNHIHMLVFVDDLQKTNPEKPAVNATIPLLVSALKRFCNAEIGKNIFQRSYYDHIVRNEKDFQRIWSYIENNPQKWSFDRYYLD